MVKGDSGSPGLLASVKKHADHAGEWVNTGDKYYVDEDGFYHAADVRRHVEGAEGYMGSRALRWRTA